VSWWVPLAFVAAGLVGVAIALSLTAGRPRTETPAEPSDVHGGSRKSRYREDNDLVWNPGAFVAAAGLVGVVVLIGVLMEVA
jgi:hypothetical protein